MLLSLFPKILNGDIVAGKSIDTSCALGLKPSFTTDQRGRTELCGFKSIRLVCGILHILSGFRSINITINNPYILILLPRRAVTMTPYFVV